MNVTIKGYSARVDWVSVNPVLEPGKKDGEMVVWVDIDSPHGLNSFGITFPLKEYTPDQLKKLIEEEGTRQFEEAITRHAAERKRSEAYIDQKLQRLGVARKVADAAGVKLLEGRE